jgi:hypothetical protein
MPKERARGAIANMMLFAPAGPTKEDVKKFLKDMTPADFSALFNALEEAAKEASEKYKTAVKENCQTAESDPNLGNFCDNNVAGASIGLGQELSAIEKIRAILTEIKKERPLNTKECQRIRLAIYGAMAPDDREPSEVVEDRFNGDWNEYYIVMAGWHNVPLDPLF